MILAGRPVTDFTHERDFVELPFGLHHKGFHLGVTSVEGPRETWLCLFGGHVPDDSATKRGDNSTLFAALEESAEQDAHPFSRLDAFPVAKVCFLVHDIGVENADLFTKSQEEVVLLSNVLVFRAHFVKFLVCGIGFGDDRFSSPVHIVESFLSGTDSLQAFPYVRDMGSERCQ